MGLFHGLPWSTKTQRGCFRVCFALVVAALVVCCSSVFGPPAKLVTVSQILQMSQEGVPPRQIIGRIQGSGSVYRLSEPQRRGLERRGVAPIVVDYMSRTYENAVSKDPERKSWEHWTQYDSYWYGGDAFD